MLIGSPHRVVEELLMAREGTSINESMAMRLSPDGYPSCHHSCMAYATNSPMLISAVTHRSIKDSRRVARSSFYESHLDESSSVCT
jgi:hypothetical protein